MYRLSKLEKYLTAIFKFKNYACVCTSKLFKQKLILIQVCTYTKYFATSCQWIDSK